MGSDITLIQIPLLAKKYSEPEELKFYDKYWEKFSNIVDKEVKRLPIYDIKELPLWIATLGATLEYNNLSVNVLDLSKYSGENINYNLVREELMKCDSPVFGLSSFSNNFSVCVEISKIIKEIFGEKATVVVGGPHVSNTVELTLENKSIDIISRGEGDISLPLIVKNIKQGKNIKDIQGISWKDKDNIIHNNPSAAAIMPDTLPLPAYHLIPESYKYVIPFGRIYTSRGCPYNCAYCADTLWNKRNPLYQTLERTMKQIDMMHERFNTNLFYVGDESFTFNKEYVKAFGQEMKKRGFNWISQTRTDLINPELLSIMKENNCKLIKFGAESANQGLLDNIRKGITVESIKKACEMAREAGLNVLLYWMVGLPGESRETAENTIKYAENLFKENLIDLVEYYITTPYPGTDLYSNPDRYKIKIIENSFDKWREDRPSVTNTEFLTRDEIFAIWKQGLNRFSSCI